MVHIKTASLPPFGVWKQLSMRVRFFVPSNGHCFSHVEFYWTLAAIRGRTLIREVPFGLTAIAPKRDDHLMQRVFVRPPQRRMFASQTGRRRHACFVPLVGTDTISRSIRSVSAQCAITYKSISVSPTSCRRAGTDSPLSARAVPETRSCRNKALRVFAETRRALLQRHAQLGTELRLVFPNESIKSAFVSLSSARDGLKKPWACTKEVQPVCRANDALELRCSARDGMKTDTLAP